MFPVGTRHRIGAPSFEPSVFPDPPRRVAAEIGEIAFYASMIVTQTPRGDAMFMAMLSSASDQILDLDSLDFLRG